MENVQSVSVRFLLECNGLFHHSENKHCGNVCVEPNVRVVMFRKRFARLQSLAGDDPDAQEVRTESLSEPALWSTIKNKYIFKKSVM